MYDISGDFSFSENFIEVLGIPLHYIEQGEGSPILFLHGVPTSSYLWRNVLPEVSQHARCIAVDLVGFGKSAKPDIAYTIFDHIRYINAFIKALDLKNITLVMHAWGSVIGFDYAMRHPANIKGLAFLEAHIRPTLAKDMVALPVQERSSILHHQDGGYAAVIENNEYINQVLPTGVIRRLTEQEMEYYRTPFSTPQSRKPIWQYLQDLPMGDSKTPVVDLIANYSKKLAQSDIAKLLLYAIPGFNTSIESIIWARKHFSHLNIVEIDEALHYAPESHPKELSAAIAKWYQTLPL
ncbi:MAG: haloalkane dehalogenase [Gammaproteobacteria bacterium]|nr:haloalkane dehalogenase [Gammaproteobacteria bacterium]